MNTLIINGHPNPHSYCSQLAQAFQKGAHSSDRLTKLLNLYELDFNLNLTNGYKNNVLEPDLTKAQQLISKSEHLVFVYPTWWWSMPAILKGFIDRMFVPDFAFKYEKGRSLPQKLLKDKTATLIVTMDSPLWYYRWWMHSAGHLVMKRGILAFCGIKTIKIITIDNHKKLSENQRIKWLQKVEDIAKKTAKVKVGDS